MFWFFLRYLADSVFFCLDSWTTWTGYKSLSQFEDSKAIKKLRKTVKIFSWVFAITNTYIFVRVEKKKHVRFVSNVFFWIIYPGDFITEMFFNFFLTLMFFPIFSRTQHIQVCWETMLWNLILKRKMSALVLKHIHSILTQCFFSKFVSWANKLNIY